MKRAKTSKAAKPRRRSSPPAATAPEEGAERTTAEDVPELEESDAAAGLQEVESELGISEWIDPDTGDPAEDSVPRLEDH